MTMPSKLEEDLDLLDFSSSDSDDEDKGSSDNKIASITKNENPIRRLAIIDALNVMHFCAGMSCFDRKNVQEDSETENRTTTTTKPDPDALGLFLMASQLLKLGFDIYAVTPISYLEGPRNVKNECILKELNKMGYVIPIEDGSHDDLVLLEMAKIVGGFVISNDKFRDHLDIAALEDVIKGRVVRFDFRAIPHEVVKNKKTYGNPKKLKYFNGFELTLKPPNALSMFAVNKNDPTFGMVYTSRVYRDELRSGDNLALIDAIAEYYLQDVCQIYGVVPPTLPYFDPAKNNLPKRLTIWLAWFMTWSQENQ